MAAKVLAIAKIVAHKFTVDLNKPLVFQLLSSKFLFLSLFGSDRIKQAKVCKDKIPKRRLRYPSIIQNLPNSEETNSEQQTAIGSLNVSNIANEPAEIQTKSGGRRKTQGLTLLKYLYELNSVERVKVARNSHGQPIGSKARLLAGYLGIIARNANLLPINYESWHHMPDSNKNQALNNIRERFDLEVSDNYVKKVLGKKWRDHKSTLKKEYFKKNISLKEKLRNIPSGMLRYQWEDEVRFWNLRKEDV
ncbi:uncharacterized protein LOC128042532 [Gossypium raimondii]|uniref:uncharacterized protein LOC128042532 n=1 Tax=Gossypium raimondii TaxID=29730 RepID=UPI00227C7E86|nr:uncharacterized protein LOC128042532 [Gossypium raimondii]